MAAPRKSSLPVHPTERSSHPRALSEAQAEGKTKAELEHRASMLINRTDGRHGAARFDAEHAAPRMLDNADLAATGHAQAAPLNEAGSLGEQMAERGQVYYPGAGRATGRISPRMTQRMSEREWMLASDPSLATDYDSEGGKEFQQGSLFHPDYLDELETKGAGLPPLRASSSAGFLPGMGSVAQAHRDYREAEVRGPASDRAAYVRKHEKELNNLQYQGAAITDRKAAVIRNVTEMTGSSVAQNMDKIDSQIHPDVKEQFYPDVGTISIAEVAADKQVPISSAINIVAKTSGQRRWLDEDHRDPVHGGARRPNLEAAAAAIDASRKITRETGERDIAGQLGHEWVEDWASKNNPGAGLMGGVTGREIISTSRELANLDPNTGVRSGPTPSWEGTDHDKQPTFALALAADHPNRGVRRQSAQAMTVDRHQAAATGMDYAEILGTGPGMHHTAFGNVPNQPGSSVQPYYNALAMINQRAVHRYNADRRGIDDEPVMTHRYAQENIWNGYAASTMADVVAKRQARALGQSGRRDPKLYAQATASANADVVHDQAQALQRASTSVWDDPQHVGAVLEGQTLEGRRRSQAFTEGFTGTSRLR